PGGGAGRGGGNWRGATPCARTPCRRPYWAAQLRRFSPPYPGQAHRTRYLGAAGAVEDTTGSLGDADEGDDV
ncbi:hypothetical protein, partial [Streptomyces sp. C]|uniref:hypothetical protein n=1 Tax=Streptomyces sp. C TaxID=253839 RepID=UPI0001B58737